MLAPWMGLNLALMVLPMPGEHARTLLVDDDDPIRSMLAKIMERLDIDVDTARDGGEAIAMMDRNRYDCVVLDLMMPRIDGYAVMRHMREHHPHLLRHTIIASAVPEQEIIRRVTDSVFRIHPKPFEIVSLLNDIGDCARSAAA
jgi:DNA-binding response OmpR family regulator